jgi:antitoxin (DNA-binding transcriptional repressor) of toxin-antitoxin stability system
MSRKPMELVEACDQLQQAVRAAGEYAHVVARVERSHLVVYAGDEEPVARLTPLGQAQYGLSFYRHDGRWERMPFSGAISEMATSLVDTLGPYLAQAKL